MGTSPRARGKHTTVHFDLKKRRNIPACAGKTYIKPNIISRGREHPRVRGENYGSAELDIGGEGTSPRARGKPI